VTSAIDTLTGAFENAFARLGASPEHDAGAVVSSWPALPVEIVRACGLRLVVARASTSVTPAADAHLEAGLFPGRVRRLIEAALSGHLSRVAHVVIPRTSDADYKCFLYLREFVRGGLAAAMAPTALFDLLQSDGPHVHRHNVERTRALLDSLAVTSGHHPSNDELRDEIRVTNTARAAVRRLAALRIGAPRASGTELFPVLAAFWHVPPRDYARLANDVAEDLSDRSPLGGPRVLLAGAPADGIGLHAAIESRGAVVVDELSAWSGPGTDDDVRCDRDPVAALADAYRQRTIGPRLPTGALRGRVLRALGHVDAVAISLPEDDATFGWDYPALRQHLQARGLPHAVLRGDPHGVPTPDDGERIERLIDAASRSRALHG
jgi:benzoyl-CoA reductase/2-hydroxyglutaryl-CoA dehydratase subunit BcrC/BadD/HgdB